MYLYIVCAATKRSLLISECNIYRFCTRKLHQEMQRLFTKMTKLECQCCFQGFSDRKQSAKVVFDNQLPFGICVSPRYLPPLRQVCLQLQSQKVVSKNGYFSFGNQFLAKTSSSHWPCCYNTFHCLFCHQLMGRAFDGVQKVQKSRSAAE